MNVRNAAVATAIALATLALPAHAQNAQDEPEEEKGGRTTADASEQMGDTWITAKVKADLLVTIDVDTKNGVVTLTGTVKSKAEADKAVSVAKDIKGVIDVKSKLEVGSPTK